MTEILLSGGSEPAKPYSAALKVIRRRHPEFDERQQAARQKLLVRRYQKERARLELSRKRNTNQSCASTEDLQVLLSRYRLGLMDRIRPDVYTTLVESIGMKSVSAAFEAEMEARNQLASHLPLAAIAAAQRKSCGEYYDPTRSIIDQAHQIWAPIADRVAEAQRRADQMSPYLSDKRIAALNHDPGLKAMIGPIADALALTGWTK